MTHAELVLDLLPRPQDVHDAGDDDPQDLAEVARQLRRDGRIGHAGAGQELGQLSGRSNVARRRTAARGRRGRARGCRPGRLRRNDCRRCRLTDGGWVGRGGPLGARTHRGRVDAGSGADHRRRDGRRVGRQWIRSPRGCPLVPTSPARGRAGRPAARSGRATGHRRAAGPAGVLAPGDARPPNRRTSRDPLRRRVRPRRRTRRSPPAAAAELRRGRRPRRDRTGRRAARGRPVRRRSGRRSRTDRPEGGRRSAARRDGCVSSQLPGELTATRFRLVSWM